MLFCEVAMARLNEVALRRLIKGGETTTVEFKVASPRPVEMAERLCGMANAQGGMIIIGVEDVECKVVGVPDERMAMTKDVILRAARQIIKPVLVLDPLNFRVLHQLHVEPDEFLADPSDRAGPHQATHPGEDIGDAALSGWWQPVLRSRAIGEAGFAVAGLAASP